MELPFLIAGATVIGGFLGYVLDRSLHTKPWLMLVLGAAGFAVGVRDLIRRLGKDDIDGSGNPPQ
jgi:F0F1-type ATP synthase assembly protein I